MRGNARTIPWSSILFAVSIAALLGAPTNQPTGMPDHLTYPAGRAPPTPTVMPTTRLLPANASVTGPQNWTEWNITNPPARVWEAMTYDLADGYLLVFGGDVYNYSTLLGPTNDTWEYRNQTWTEVCSGAHATPFCAVNPPAGPASMTYDPAAGYVLLVDTNGSSWAYLGGIWHELNATGKPAICPNMNQCGQAAAPLAYDPRTGEVVLISPSGETWDFANGTWTDLGTDSTAPVGYQNVLYYDPEYTDLVYMDGSASQVFHYQGNASWLPISLGSPSGTHPPGFTPSCASSSYMGGGDFDPTLGGVVAVYYSSCYTYGTTWLLKNDNWTNFTTAVGHPPPPGDWRAMAFDNSDNYSVLLDGENVSASGPAEYNQTWGLVDTLATAVAADPNQVELGQNLTLNLSVVGGLRPYQVSATGLPTGCHLPDNGVSEVCSPLVAGSYTIRVNVTDPSTNETATSQASVTVFPKLVASAAAESATTTVGFSANFSATVMGGRAPYSPLWAFGDGSSAPDLNVTHVYGVRGNFTANFSVHDSLNVTVGVSGISVVVNDPLVMTATSNRTVTDAGLPVSFIANPIEGTVPYNVAWTFGDGTASATGSTVNHPYADPGSYTARVTATDAVGDTRNASLTITVNSDPSARMTVNDSRPYNGTYVLFTGTEAGGTPPFSYVWSFGDGSRGGMNGTFPGESFEHRYLTVGNYTAQLAVTDSLGIIRMAEVNVSVQSTATTPGTGTPPAASFLSGATLLAVEVGLGLAAVVALVSGAIYHRRRRDGGN